MKELIKVREKNGQKLVSAKELYLGLGLSKKEWSRWCVRNIINNEFFFENDNWVGFVVKTNGNETKDFAISLDFAKHLAMMARTEKSHEYRNYFIECEKKLNNIVPEITDKQRLQLMLFSGDDLQIVTAHKQLVELEIKPYIEKIEEDKPLVDFASRIMKRGDNILVRELAKIITDEGYKIGQNRLYDVLRGWGYVLKNKTEPTQRAMNSNYLIVETGIKSTPYGDKQFFTTKVTPKGQIRIVERILKENDLLEVS